MPGFGYCTIDKYVLVNTGCHLTRSSLTVCGLFINCSCEILEGLYRTVMLLFIAIAASPSRGKIDSIQVTKLLSCAGVTAILSFTRGTYRPGSSIISACKIIASASTPLCFTLLACAQARTIVIETYISVNAALLPGMIM